jgi:catechol 2,3-dioxygenase-like lactoylglutathione lyase family enzyme
MKMKLELISVPVSDVDKAKTFYIEKLGFHLDYDRKINDSLRGVQLTPPGSECSIMFGLGVTSMKPGSIESLLLVVDDIQKARTELAEHGVEISEIKVMPWGASHAFFSDPDGNKWQLQQPRRNE